MPLFHALHRSCCPKNSKCSSGVHPPESPPWSLIPPKPSALVQVLQNSNVETFITFRSSTPMIMSLCDWMFLGRALPSLRSWLCLVFLIGGALGYVLVDTAFKLEAYLWLVAWWVDVGGLQWAFAVHWMWEKALLVAGGRGW